MRNAHLTAEDFRILLENDEGEGSIAPLHHLVFCPVCYRVGEYLLHALSSGCAVLTAATEPCDPATED
jgi:hypothetical protein